MRDVRNREIPLPGLAVVAAFRILQSHERIVPVFGTRMILDEVIHMLFTEKMFPDISRSKVELRFSAQRGFRHTQNVRKGAESAFTRLGTSIFPVPDSLFTYPHKFGKTKLRNPELFPSGGDDVPDFDVCHSDLLNKTSEPVH